ncbi:hypothetical protein UPYG_G00147170 [Umbra pygmaea]|uniref:Sodium channel regulatory subunit beta-3 n=1 Tax=Umbra pygmaea TaxID=75934 RepID=A0ABD0XCQ6_UMBPY
MISVWRLLVPSTLWALQASLCHGACVEVDSDTDAVVNAGFKLGCIYCKMRAEVHATAIVDWYFKAPGETNFTHIYNYQYMNEESSNTIKHFRDRLVWNGTKKTKDLEDASIYILNVTWNDTGTYKCFVNRTLNFPSYIYTTNSTKFVQLNVVPQRKALGYRVTLTNIQANIHRHIQ